MQVLHEFRHFEGAYVFRQSCGFYIFTVIHGKVSDEALSSFSLGQAVFGESVRSIDESLAGHSLQEQFAEPYVPSYLFG